MGHHSGSNVSNLTRSRQAVVCECSALEASANQLNARQRNAKATDNRRRYLAEVDGRNESKNELQNGRHEGSAKDTAKRDTPCLAICMCSGSLRRDAFSWLASLPKCVSSTINCSIIQNLEISALVHALQALRARERDLRGERPQMMVML
jgi:hypothetical protein